MDEWRLRAVLGVSFAPRVRAQSCLTSGHDLPTEPHTAFQPGSTPGDHQVNVAEKEPHPIRQQYDEMVKYATALRLGTADADTILKRFTRDNLQHPTYQALVELGKAIKTRFLCHYLHAETLRREVHEGLNVVENWNSANDFIFYGKGGEIATKQLDDQEIAVLSLHLTQACLVYINTLMLQQVLDAPRWREKMTLEDYRALTPLIYHHVNP
ncbi:MAG: Tn3 family transposase, partial [Pyrinomonadaceae bacterium]